MKVTVLLAGMAAILAAFVVMDADARLAASWLDERGFGHMIEVDGKPYVTVGYASVYLVDYSDPVRPLIVSKISELYGFPFVNYFEKDGRTYVATTGATGDLSITFIDVTDIYRPKIVSQVSYGDEGWDMLEYGASDVVIFQQDGKLYASVSAAWGHLIIDINDPKNPKPISQYNERSAQLTQAVRDHVVVELDGRLYQLAPDINPDGIPAMDITDPLNPKPADEPLFYVDTSSGRTSGKLELDGHTYIMFHSHNAYNGGGGNVSVYDITGHAGGTLDESRLASSIYVPVEPAVAEPFKIGNRAYVVVVGFEGGRDEGSIPSGLYSYEIDQALAQYYADIAAGNVSVRDGAVIVDITDPRNPEIISSFDMRLAADIRDGRDRYIPLDDQFIAIGKIQGKTFVILVHDSKIVSVYDVTDPDNPVADYNTRYFDFDGKNAFADANSIGTFTDDGGSTYAVAATGFSREGSIKIFDITDPSNTIETSRINTDGMGELRIFEQEGNVYAVSNSYWDVRTFDITDPHNPVVLATFAEDDYGQSLGIFSVVDISGKPHLLHRSDSGFIYAHDLSDPANPVYIASAIAGGFYAVRETRDVVVTEIDGATYALGVGHDGGGAMQVTKIHGHGQVEPVAALFRGMNGFDALYRAWGVDVAHIDGGHYAVVAGEYDGGSVQIIDISNPEVPRPVTIVTDEQNGFDHLADPWGVATAEINGRHYAVTASRGDNAVQIIDITDPASPRPAGFVAAERETEMPTRDDIGNWAGSRAAGGSLELWPENIEVVELEGRHYAVVLAGRNDVIQMVDITNPGSPEVTGSKRVTGASTLDVTTFDGRTFAVVAAAAANGGYLRVLELTGGSLSGAGKLDLPWADPESVRQGMGFGAGADGHHAFYTNGDGTYYIDISNPRSPDIVSKSGALASRAAVHVIDGVPHALTFSVGGMSIHAYDYPGKIYNLGGGHDGFVPAISSPVVAVSAIFDGHEGFDYLAGANSVVTIWAHDISYAIAGGDEGLQVIDVSDPYHPSPVTAIDGIHVRDMELIKTAFGYNLVAETAFVVRDPVSGAVMRDPVSGGIYIDYKVLSFDVTDPANPIQVGVSTGLSEISTENDPYDPVGVVYLSGEPSVIYASRDDGIRVVDGFDINTQRLDALLSVENATAAALSEIDGVVYGFVAAIGHYSDLYKNPASLYKSKTGNLLVYDVADPHNPAKLVGLLDDGSQSFTDDPRHLETFEVAGKYYAVGLGKYGLYIIDVTDPLDPTASDGAGDDGSNFRALANASDFDLIVIDGRLYGLVASPTDDGIQIMDLTYLAER